MRGHVLENLVLPPGFVDGHFGSLLDVPDLFDDAGPLIQQRQDSEIEFVDLLTAFVEGFEGGFAGQENLLPPMNADEPAIADLVGHLET
jgi:hypothetical protein